jgi:ABC-2 type transport system permease protein
MNKLVMLVRRELWEHRSLWIVPLVMAGVLMLVVAIGGFHFSDKDFSFGPNDAAAHLEHVPPEQRAEMLEKLTPDAEKRKVLYAVVIGMPTMIMLLALGVVVFFYLLDALLQERKDRSILFWKSLPVSDSQVVASKAATGLLIAPAITLVIAAVMQILFGSIVWLRMHNTLLGGLLPAWDVMAWLRIQIDLLMLVVTVILWYAPIAGYLLLVSVWARKNAFLWAVLPWPALLLIEKLILNSSKVAEFLGSRFGGVFREMAFGDRQMNGWEDRAPSFGEVASHIGNVFTSLELWLGLAAAALFFVAVVRIRRYRDEN